MSSSLASRLADLPKPERDEVLASLTEAERQALLYDWDFWARPEQRLPEGDWTVWLYLSGRGGGKTRTAAEAVRRATRTHRRIAIVAATPADARDICVQGESGLLNVCPPGERPTYEPTKRRVTWPNGAIATIYSGYEPDQLRGPEHDLAWVDELAKFAYPQESWDNLMLGLRIGSKPRVIVTTTPRPIPVIKSLVAMPHVYVTRGTTFDNLDNLAGSFREHVLARYEGTTLGRQELYGEIIEDVEGALWKRVDIERGRIAQAPPLSRVVVGVDPSGSRTGDECGIVCAGRGKDGDFYVLDDRSLQASSDTWARAAVAAYHAHKADRIVAERNYGGDMVENTIRTVDPLVSYWPVDATRGKQIRAEPIAALYEQGRVHHVGSFPDLEDQLCSWTPGDKRSPDRLDACVWALTELVLRGDRKASSPTLPTQRIVRSFGEGR